MPRYTYELSGTNSSGKTWLVAGHMVAELGLFSVVPNTVLRDAFAKLTADCDGPYCFRRLLIEEAGE